MLMISTNGSKMKLLCSESQMMGIVGWPLAVTLVLFLWVDMNLGLTIKAIHRINVVRTELESS